MARSKRPQQPEVGPPEWSAMTAVARIKDLLQRGRGMQSKQVPEEERKAWDMAVDSTMAAAFGRNSAEHVNAKSAIYSHRIAVVSDWGRGPDDYPQRLAKQLSAIEEYAKILEQRAEDETARAPKVEPPPPAVDTVLHILSRFSRVA